MLSWVSYARTARIDTWGRNDMTGTARIINRPEDRVDPAAALTYFSAFSNVT